MSVVIRNRKAYYNYEIAEKYEAGIKLFGLEVKAIKEGKGQLAGSFIKIEGNSVWIIGLHIPPYSKSGNLQSYDPSRRRKLLLRSEEIKSLKGKMDRKGYSLVPLKIYLKGNLIKVQAGLVKGRKKVQKKEELIKKQQKRELDRMPKVRIR